FFFQAEDGIRDFHVTGVQTCALPIYEPAFVHRCGGHGRGRGRSGCCRSHRGGGRYRRLLGWRLGAFEAAVVGVTKAVVATLCHRSEEHTSELQSRENLVCRLLLEKKK